MCTWFLICETTFPVDISIFILICETLILFVSTVWWSGSAESCPSYESLSNQGSDAWWACDRFVCAMTRWYVCHDSLICVPWLVDRCAVTRQYAHMTRWYVDMTRWACDCLVCAMTRWYLRRDSFICPHDSLICVTWLVSMLTWLVDMWPWLVDMWTWLVMSVWLPCTCHDSLIFVTWLVDVCDVTRWCVWRDSFTYEEHDWVDGSRDECGTALYVPWLVTMRGVTHWCVRYDWTWLVRMLDMTRCYVCHDSLMCSMTRCYVCHDSLMCNMTACLVNMVIWLVLRCGLDSWYVKPRGGGLGSRPKKMYGKRLEDGVENHLMSPTPRR